MRNFVCPSIIMASMRSATRLFWGREKLGLLRRPRMTFFSAP